MIIRSSILIFIGYVLISCSSCSSQRKSNSLTNVSYGKEKVGEIDIFYREAGDSSKPKIVLLHGFPSSSHMYREVLSSLSNEFHLIAPDYPGFGDSSNPSTEQFKYTFDNISEVIEKFLAQKGFDQFYIMIQDYGAPIGFRIATKDPKKIRGIITQNGNAYKEGLSAKGWGPIFKYWKDKNNKKLEDKIASQVFSLEGLKWQYTHGTRNPETILPDNWNLDYMKLSREGQKRIQLDLFYDYQNNVTLYPKWQKYLKDYQPPLLIVWGKNDAFFPEAGAEAFKKDVKKIDYNILDTGHFALEEESDLIIKKIRNFVRRNK